MFKSTRIRELEKLKLVLGATTSKYLQELFLGLKFGEPCHMIHYYFLGHKVV